MATLGSRIFVAAAFLMLCLCQSVVHGARPVPANAAAVKNLVTALQQAGIFSTSLGYMQRDGNAGILAFVSQVLDAGSVTIFLPTDNAWKAVGPSKTRSLSQKRQLAQVFKFHMVRQYIPSRILISAQPGSPLLTMEGSLLVKQKSNDPAKQNIIIGESYKENRAEQMGHGRGNGNGNGNNGNGNNGRNGNGNNGNGNQVGVVVQPDIYLDATSKVAIHGFNAVLFPPDF